MRQLLLLIVLILSACGGGGESKPEPVVVTPPPPPPVEWEVFTPEFKDRADRHGILEQLNDNSWTMASHVIDYPECERANNHFCKKVDVHYYYDGHWTKGREMKMTFDFTVEKWNFDDPAYHVIVWQDWFRYDHDDPTGSHPFTTLKLKPWRGVSLAAYNNRWQWDYSYLDPYDPEDPPDLLHRHPEDEWTGQKKLEIGQTYKIEIIMKDGHTLEGGEVIINVDGELFSHETYQTKPIEPVTTTVHSFGAYWYRDYNPRVNGCVEATGELEQICKSIKVRFENYEVYTRIN